MDEAPIGEKTPLVRQVPGAEAGGSPIFIVGLLHRVGTNFLAHALASHPACTSATALQEDFLISELNLLERYGTLVQRRWNPKWGAREKTPQLLKRLGNALIDFAYADAAEHGKRLVLKTPSVSGLECVQQFLPDCRIVVLVRNGPDVIESGMRSFGWSFEEGCRLWGNAARHLVDVCHYRGKEDDLPFIVVRYEDLIAEPVSTFERILRYVDLSIDDFDMTSVSSMPIYGSSTERGGADKVHWQPVARSAGFDPLKRSAGWSQDALDRFNWLTGSVSQQLGYDITPALDDSLSRRVWHSLRDQKARLPRPIRQRLKYSPSRGVQAAQ